MNVKNQQQRQKGKKQTNEKKSAESMLIQMKM